MTKSSNLYVGMDVHKDSIDIALADGEGQEERHFGSIGGDLTTLDQALRRLQATGMRLHFVYEASPCGYPPKLAVSALVNSRKGVPSRLLRKKLPDIASRYWKGVLWSPSYFASSCGGAPISLIRQHIEHQQTPH